jgi:hypothetical protein
VSKLSRFFLVIIFLVIIGSSFSLAQAKSIDPNTPWKMHVIDNSLRGADGVRLADANGDGLVDVATGWEGSSKSRVYFHPGYKDVTKPWPNVTVGPAYSVEDAVFADLDGDGFYDIISSCEGSTRMVLIHWAPSDMKEYVNEKSWNTEFIPASAMLTGWMFCVPMDVDGANGIDLIAGGKTMKQTQGKLGWFEAPSDPRKVSDWNWHQIANVEWIMSIISYDMDYDGDMDIVVTDRYKDGFKWYENPGIGPAQKLLWKSHIIGNSGTALFMTIADLDGDGVDDVLIAAEGLVSWPRRLDKSGDKWKEYVIPLSSHVGLAKGIAVGDVDQDGKLDIVVTCWTATNKTGVFWMSYVDSLTSGIWNINEISGIKGSKFDLIQLFDIDGDGDLDVMTTEEAEGLGVIWYENPLIS